jgi:hypothetical protein
MQMFSWNYHVTTGISFRRISLRAVYWFIRVNDFKIPMAIIFHHSWVSHLIRKPVQLRDCRKLEGAQH